MVPPVIEPPLDEPTEPLVPLVSSTTISNQLPETLTINMTLLETTLEVYSVDMNHYLSSSEPVADPITVFELRSDENVPYALQAAADWVNFI